MSPRFVVYIFPCTRLGYGICSVYAPSGRRSFAICVLFFVSKNLHFPIFVRHSSAQISRSWGSIFLSFVYSFITSALLVCLYFLYNALHMRCILLREFRYVVFIVWRFITYSIRLGIERSHVSYLLEKTNRACSLRELNITFIKIRYVVFIVWRFITYSIRPGIERSHVSYLHVKINRACSLRNLNIIFFKMMPLRYSVTPCDDEHISCYFVL